MNEYKENMINNKLHILNPDDEAVVLDYKLYSLLNIDQRDDVCIKGVFVRTVRSSVERVKTCLVKEFPTHLTGDFFHVGKLLLKHIMNSSEAPTTKLNYKTDSPVSIVHFDYEHEQSISYVQEPMSPKSSTIIPSAIITPTISPSTLITPTESPSTLAETLEQPKSLTEFFDITSSYSSRFKNLRKDDPIRTSLVALIIVLITLSRPLKYQSLGDFVDAYPEFSSSSIDQYELLKLMQNANLMASAVTFLAPSQNKGIIMNVVPRLAEGPHVKYITGGGSSNATTNRVLLFEKEGNTTQKKRSVSKKQKKKSKSISPYLTLSSFSCDKNAFHKNYSFGEEELVFDRDSSVNSEISSHYKSLSSCSNASNNSRTNSIDMSHLYESIPFLINVPALLWYNYDEMDLEREYAVIEDCDVGSKRQRVCSDDATSWDILVNVAKSFL